MKEPKLGPTGPNQPACQGCWAPASSGAGAQGPAAPLCPEASSLGCSGASTRAAVAAAAAHPGQGLSSHLGQPRAALEPDGLWPSAGEPHKCPIPSSSGLRSPGCLFAPDFCPGGSGASLERGRGRRPICRKALQQLQQGGSLPQGRVGGATKLLDWFSWTSKCAAREAGPRWTPVWLSTGPGTSPPLREGHRSGPSLSSKQLFSCQRGLLVGGHWSAAYGVQLNRRPGWVLKGTSRPMFPIPWLCRRSGRSPATCIPHSGGLEGKGAARAHG